MVWCLQSIKLLLEQNYYVETNSRKLLVFNDDIFSDEVTFHINGSVCRHNVRIWGFKHPNEMFKKETDTSK